MPTQPLPYGLPHPPAGWSQKPPGISLCMIVKNEERFLERCLESVAGIVDEINIVDTGSTDRTVEIAQRFGARIQHREWRNDFAWARNEAIAMATKRWILQLDADEEVREESREDLKAIGRIPAHLGGLLVRCTNLMNDASGTVSHAVTRIFPNHPRIRFRGRIHEFPALGNADTTVPSRPTNLKIVHYGYLDAVISERNKHQRNMDLLEACIAEEPENAYHWYNLGLTAHVCGDQQRAVDALERTWEICKADGMRLFIGNALQMLSTIYTESLGQPETGLAYAMECLKLAPHYANAHFAAGKSYAAKGDYVNARAMYLAAVDDAAYLERQFIVDEDASGWKPLCEIGTTYQNEGQWQQAIEWFDKALQRRADVRVVQLRRAAAFEHLERYDQAEACFESMHEAFHDEQSALQYINYLLRHNGAKAVEAIEREYRSLPAGIAVPMLVAAASTMQREKLGDGERQLLAARELSPESAQANAALEELYRLRGDFASAYGAAQSALAAQPANEVLRYNAAIDAVNLGLKDQALNHLSAIPRESGETGLRAAYLRGVLLRELGRLDEALTACDLVLSLDASQLDALLLRASVLECAQRIDEAESVFTSALPLNPRRAAVELAGFYLRQGRALDAKRVAEEALAS